MPELPEVASRAREIEKELTGKTIKEIEVLQPKCLNVSKKKFVGALTGAKILGTTYHGKWIFTRTTKGHLLINMGMGGEMLLVDRKSMPEKWRIAFHFKDRTTLAINFWWFGYTHYAEEGKLDKHAMSAKLGPNAIDVGLQDFREMLKGRKGTIKSFLLNQERIAGIGNAYVHDILFLARLHPLRKIDTLTDGEVEALWKGIQGGLRPSLKKRGAFYEKDLHGRRGGFKMKDILVGYREGKPCPSCGAKVVKIRTGSTASFICPRCQPLKPPKKQARGKARKAPGKSPGGEKRKLAERRAGAKKSATKSTRKPAGAKKSGKKPAQKRVAAKKPAATKARKTTKSSGSRRKRSGGR